MRNMLKPHVGARPDSTSAIAHWKLDEASGNAVDALTGYDLTASGSPGAVASLFAVPSGSTGARTFNGSTQYFSASGTAAFVNHFTANHCFSAVFKPDVVSGTRTIFAYTTSGETLATNALFVVRLVGDEIGWIWEYGSGTNVSQTTSGLNLSAGTAYLVTIAIDDASNGTAGACDVRLYVFEQGVGLIFEQTWTNQTRAAGGTSSNPAIGYDSGIPGNYFDGTIDDVVLWSYPLTRDAAFILYGETFGISYDEETLYESGNAVYCLRVRVADSAGTLHDLTSIAHSQDLVVSADVSDNIDAPGATANISVVRESDGWSLAPDMQASPLNRLTGSYSALLTLNRRILIDTAVIPQGATPNPWDFVPLFEGYISSLDWGADEIDIQAGDKMGPLFTTYIDYQPLQIDLIDDSGTGGAVQVATVTDHGLSAGDKVLIAGTTNYDGRYTVATVTGLQQFDTVETLSGSLASESSGYIFTGDERPYGSDVGVPVETVIQQIINDNAPTYYRDQSGAGYIGGTPTLYTPTTPSFDVKNFFQKREPVQTAIENLAAMFGWNVKYRWHSAAMDFRLTLHDPERSKALPDYTFSNDEIIEVSRASVEGADIRNVVEVIYSDFANADENNFAPRVTVRSINATSVSKYGYRLCQIAESSTSQINTSAEAQDLADAVLSDLAEPKADIEIEVPLRRFIDVSDLHGILSDGYHWDASKTVAVTGYAHSFTDGRATTSVSLRGKPASMNKGWKNRFVLPGIAPNQPTTPPHSGTTAPTLTPIPGGADVFRAIPNDLRSRRFDTVEIHVSQTSGFTPDASTYSQLSRTNRAILTGLDPAQTHYVRMQLRDKFGNVSRWSDQAAVTPTYMLSVPAARAYRATSAQSISATTWTTVQFNAEDYDRRSNYNPATYKFTAPVSGIYSILCHVAVNFLGKSSQAAEIRLMKNGATLVATGTSVIGEDHNYIAHPTINSSIALSASDAVFVQVWGQDSCQIDYAANAAQATSFFSIVLTSQD